MVDRGGVILVDQIEPRILEIRGQKILVDADLATLYGVTTKRLNQQVGRNQDRFPTDFQFQLTAEEKAEVVANCNHLAKLKFSSQLPFAYTEHGTVMAASVLNTPLAIEVSVFVVRAFVKLRQFALTHKELGIKLTELERRVTGHDESIRQLVAAIRQLATPLAAGKPRRRIGFRGGSESDQSPTPTSSTDGAGPRSRKRY